MTSVSTNVGGIVKTITLLHENVGGTLQQIFPKVIESKYNARLSVSSGGGPLSGPGGGSSGGYSNIGEIKPGVTINMDTQTSASGASYTFNSKTLYDGSSNQYVYITSNCKVTVKITCYGGGAGTSGGGSGHATFGINGVTKFNGYSGDSYNTTFNLTPNDYISASSSSNVIGAAGTSAVIGARVDYTLTFTSA